MLQLLYRRNGRIVLTIGASSLKKHPNDEEVLKTNSCCARSLSAIFALRKLSHSGQKACLAVIDALSTMPQQSSTHALVSIALNSPIDEVSRSAVYALKSRSLYGYVPYLLSLMKMPVRYEYDVLRLSLDNVTGQFMMFQEGPDENRFWSFNNSQTQLPNMHGPINQAERDHARCRAVWKQRAAMNAIKLSNRTNKLSDSIVFWHQSWKQPPNNNWGVTRFAWWNWW